MYISKIKIENYKGFNNHDTIELKQGVNLIIGKNNSGKTALLEALTFNVSKPHLSESNKQRSSSRIATSSTISGEMVISKEKLFNYVEDFIPNQEFTAPISLVGNIILTLKNEFKFPKNVEGTLFSLDLYKWYFRKFSGNSYICVKNK
jgi:predicted ATP-dependent endonuclease of OLD family